MGSYVRVNLHKTAEKYKNNPSQVLCVIELWAHPEQWLQSPQSCFIMGSAVLLWNRTQNLPLWVSSRWFPQREDELICSFFRTKRLKRFPDWMAAERRLCQRPGKSPRTLGSVSDTERRVSGMLAARQTEASSGLDLSCLDQNHCCRKLQDYGFLLKRSGELNERK